MYAIALEWMLRFSRTSALLVLLSIVLIRLARVVDLQAQATNPALDSVCAYGDPRTAIGACNRLLAINARLAGARDTMSAKRSLLYVNRGNAHDKLGESGSAMADYDTALALDPYSAYAWRNKGVAFYGLHRLDDALHCYDAAIQANPNYVTAWVSRADLLRDMADTSHNAVPLAERAILDYDRALALGLRDEHDKWSAYVSRGLLEHYLHRFDQAIADFTIGIQMEPSLKLYLTRATAYADAGDVRHAMKDVDAAAALVRTPADSQLVQDERDYVTRKQRAPQ